MDALTIYTFSVRCAFSTRSGIVVPDNEGDTTMSIAHTAEGPVLGVELALFWSFLYKVAQDTILAPPRLFMHILRAKELSPIEYAAVFVLAIFAFSLSYGLVQAYYGSYGILRVTLIIWASVLGVVYTISNGIEDYLLRGDDPLYEEDE